MKMRAVVKIYVAYKREMGMKFVTEDRILKAYCQFFENIPLRRVRDKRVLEFLLVNGQRTRFWEIKYSVLRGFYQFAISRGYARRLPLPPRMSRRPQVLVPYIYSQQELAALLRAASERCPRQSRVQPYVFRTLLLLLYGAALRISEALSMKLSDVDMKKARISVRDTKFFKARVLPLGPQLTNAFKEYLSRRNREHCSAPDAPCFPYKNGKPISRGSFERRFRLLCQRIDIRRAGGARVQPRLHDLRHSAAVHRVISWYRDGKDVQRLLPQLATYLGQANLNTTNIYAEIDLDTKARALASCAPKDPRTAKRRSWKAHPAIMEFLRGL
jgi:integrase/recombinase XerD